MKDTAKAQIVHDEQRETQLQEMCRIILNMSAETFYNPNGADETICPFCRERVYRADKDMSDIKHDPKDCAYLIAKDLSTTI